MRFSFIILSILFFNVGSMAQNSELIIGLWIPEDSIYSSMKYQNSCITITVNTWTSFQCINTTTNNSPTKYNFKSKNKIIRTADGEPPVYYKIKYLDKNKMVFKEYVKRKFWFRRIIRRNAVYFRRT